jgi:hypothetical protein
MRVVVTAALLALAAPLPAAAAPPAAPPERGPVLSVRAGYGVPAGDTMRAGPAVSEVVERKFPLAFLVGYRLSPHFWTQLAFELAPATPAPALCAGGTSCSASDVHLGAQLVLRLLPGARIDPWLGGGVGVEVLSASGRPPGSPTAARTSWSWAGVELPYVEAGADVALSSWIGVGPWASLSFARYTSDSVKVEGSETVSGATHSRTVHRWIAGGLQATLRL